MSESEMVPFEPKNAAALPEHIKAAMVAGGGAGMEWVTPADLIFARIKVIQSGDKIAKERGPDNKPLASEGDIWHKQNAKVYAPFGGAVRVIPIVCQREFLHWHSRASGKGLAEKSTDPKSEIARACYMASDAAKAGSGKKDDSIDSYNESHSWLLWDIERSEAYVFSFARGNIAESQALLSMLSMKKIPMQAYVFDLYPFMKTPRPPHPKYPAANLRQVGWSSPATLAHLQKVAEGMRGKDFAAPEDEAPVEPVGTSGTASEDLT